MRIPNWVDRATLKVDVNGSTVHGDRIRFDKSYLTIGSLKKSDVGTIIFDVPIKTEKELIEGVEFTATWCGNQVIKIEPRGEESPLPF